MKQNYFTLGLFMLLSVSLLKAQNQDYVQLMQDKNATFEQVRNSFNNYWQGKTPTKGSGWKAFKRYEDFIKDRIDPKTGRFENYTSTFTEYQKYFGSNSLNKSVSLQSTWNPIKPYQSIPIGGGAGRINCVAFHPTNQSIVFVGAPVGGIWRSYDGGNSWTSNTDQLASLGISDIAFNPKNPNIVYAASGDRDAGDSYAIGILKSIDGGLTWNTTGISFTTSQNKSFGRILVHPTNPDTVLVAGTDGIYKTTNGGANWTLKYSGTIKDMEFKPGNPNIVYACNTTFIRSTDNGETFTTVAGLSSPSRIAIAVTPANSNYVYAIAGNGAGGLQGIYRSDNSGVSFTTRTTSPNVLNWSSAGTGASDGQASYDLAIAVSPTNAQEIYTGGVNVWKSLNGGTNMYCVAHWSSANGLPYVHADIHDLIYDANGDIFVGCDGGVFNSFDFGTSWNDLSNGLSIAQIYRLSTSQTDTSLTITGWQDNGTNLFDNGTASEVIGGDGMDCQINFTNANVMYGSLYYGDIRKSTNGGNSFSTIVNSNGTGVNSSSAWVTPYALDPNNANNIYIGKTQVYLSTNSGSTWAQVGNLGGGNADQIAISAGTTDKNIYVSKGASLFVKKGSAAFTTITGLPSASIRDIEVSPNDKDKVWVTLGSYTSSTVFYSSNAGATWTNISAGLPQVPANCVIHQKNTANIYVGTDIGVFYKDTNSAVFVPYGTGLPNVVVTDLDIQYTLNRLRVATYGRGLWEIATYQAPNVAPVAAFSVNKQTTCQAQSVTFTDNSANSPNNRTWTFTGGTPSTSNLFSPSVVYNTPGIYPVKLKVSNAIGSDSITQINYITVLTGPSIALDSASILKCKFDDTVSFSSTGVGVVSYSWTPPIGISSPSLGVFNCFTQNPGTYIIKGTDAIGCTGFDTVTIALKAPPTGISISSISGGFKLNSANPAATTTFQWFVNGSAIPNATNDTLLTTAAGAYSCRVTIANGCTRTSNVLNFLSINTNSSAVNAIFDILPNPNSGKFSIKAESKESIKKIAISDVLGRSIASIKVESNQWNKTVTLENPGLYFIALINNEGKTIGIKKVMVN
jgi:PKD repeat protein